MAENALRDLFAAAWLDGLGQKAAEVDERRVRLDDTDRAPFVPLRPAGGDRG